MKLKLCLYAFTAMSLCGISIDAQSVAITSARIVAVSGATIEKGTVVIRDGLIQAVGADAKTPADAQVIDGSGLTVYPGFIASLSTPGPAGQTQQRPAGGPGGGGGGQGAQQAAAQ